MDDPLIQPDDSPAPIGGDYALAADEPVLDADARPALPDHLVPNYAEIRRTLVPRPSRWTFFSGVFTFPWRSNYSQRWAYTYMTAGLTALLILGLIFEGIAAQFSGVAAGMLLVFLFFPIMVLAVLTVAYTAACCVCVLETTAAGEDDVGSWPEADWTDWLAHLAYLTWIGAVPLAASYGLGLTAMNWGIPLRSTLPCLFFLFYPLGLMSALNADSNWVPMTRPVLNSLVRWWWCWLLFYILSGVVVFGLAIITIGSLKSSPHAFLICLGPLLPGALLIYFRLFGRLAWRMAFCGQTLDKLPDD